MLHGTQTKIFAGLFAAQLAVAMAPAPGAEAPTHFINDQGELMSVDPPDPHRQPLFVAVPVSGEQAKSSDPHIEKRASPNR